MNSCNTTIEPRLIALLNDTSPIYAAPSYLELPPLQKPDIPKTLCQPLHLEPATRVVNREKETSSHLKSSHINISLAINDKSLLNDVKRLSNSRIEHTIIESSRQSLSKILDISDCGSPHSKKKRNLINTNKDEFVRLPRPTKKPKTAKQVVPPIITGLFQPPPQSTLFPPIASSCFHDSHGRNSLNTTPIGTNLPSKKQEDKHDHIIEKITIRSNGIKEQRKVAARKKWTEEETNNLLLGVHKHGVGCWADILNDSCFVFNERSPSDLKDRWRTCCPEELRKRVSTGFDSTEKVACSKTRSCLIPDEIHIQKESKSNKTGLVTSSPTVNKKKRSHRKELEDLLRLGIKGPIRQSSRRERRQFTEEEDCAILEGYNTFGPAWSKIQKDPRLYLQSRQPTDIRDRFRNKFKDKFFETKRNLDPLVTSKNERRTNDATDIFGRDNYVQSHLVPIKKTEFQSTQSNLLPHPNRDGLRIQEILSSEPFNALIDPSPMESVENLSLNQYSDWSQSTATPYSNIIGDVDISRLILDENWPCFLQNKDKQSYPEVNNLILTGSETFHHLPSFFSIFNEADDLA